MNLNLGMGSCGTFETSMGRFGNIYPYGKHKSGTLQNTDEITLGKHTE